jgi:translation elongation factor EF-G
MEYGDMSSLVVEYPDYNSFGLPLVSLGKTQGSGSWSTEFKRFKEVVSLPKSLHSVA